MDTLEDEVELWDSFRDGNYNAFRSIYERNFNQLFAYGLKVCHNKEQVEDAIQDLFMDLWKYKKGLSTTTSIKFYLFRSLRRKIYKNQSRVVMVSDEKVSMEQKSQHTVDVESQIIVKEEANVNKEKLLKGLKTLPDRQYDALVLRFFGNFSYEDLADLLGVNTQSARNLVQRGLQKLGNTLIVFVTLIVNYFLEK